MSQIKDKLDDLLAKGRITQEQYEELIAAVSDEEAPETEQQSLPVEPLPVQTEPPSSPEKPPSASTAASHLTVRLVSEDLRVRGVPGLPAVRVVHGASSITVQQQNNDVIIESNIAREGHTFFSFTINGFSTQIVELEVPADIACDLKTVSGDIELEDLQGAVEVRSVSGDIQAHGLPRLTTVNSTSGDIDIDECFLDGEAVSKSGDVDVDSCTIHGLLKSYSGDMGVEDSILNDADVSTFSGDVQLNGVTIQSSARLRTTSGDVDASLNQHDVLVDVDTRSGEATVRGPDINMRVQRQRIPVGKATVTLAAHSGSGDINISLK